MQMTSTYDHRVIQGAQSGEYLRRRRRVLQGADGFYEDVFASLGLQAATRSHRDYARRHRSRYDAAIRRDAARRRGRHGDRLGLPRCTGISARISIRSGTEPVGDASLIRRPMV